MSDTTTTAAAAEAVESTEQEAPEATAVESAAEGQEATPDEGAATTPEAEETDREEDSQEAEEPVDEEESEEPEDSASDEKLLKQLRKKNAENRRLRERATLAEAKLLKREVAEEVGLPSSMASRLTGDTREALLEDAKAFAEEISWRNYVPGAPPRDGLRRGDVRTTRPEEETDLNKIGARIYER